MVYIYQKEAHNLDVLEESILLSSFANVYQYLVGEQGCNSENKTKCRLDCVQPCASSLVVVVSRVLTTEEKIELDNIVNN